MVGKVFTDTSVGVTHGFIAACDGTHILRVRTWALRRPVMVLPILLLGIVNTGLDCYLYFSPIGSLPVQTVSIFGYLELLSALVFSAVILGERLDPVQWVGAVLILGVRHSENFSGLGKLEFCE